MITFQELYEYIFDITSGVYFQYNGKYCGVDPFNHTKYEAWYGDKSQTMSSIFDVFNTPFFDGKSLTDIFPEIVSTINM